MNKAGVSFMINNMFVVFMKEDVTIQQMFDLWWPILLLLPRDANESPFSSNIYGR